MTYDIPANSQRVIQIDRTQTASLTPGQEIAYYINDTSGNQIAVSSLINSQEVVTMIDTSTQVAVTEDTEPTYRTTARPAPARRATVRGFW